MTRKAVITRQSVRSLIRSGLRVSLFSVDQALLSLSNLTASVIAAHALPTSEFGAFGIVFATYTLVLFGVRSMTGEVLLLVGCDQARQDGAANLIIAALCGLAAGILMGVAAALIDGPVAGALVPLAIAMAGLSVQDTIRYIGFSTNRISLALAVDGLWLILMLAISLLFLADGPSLSQVIGTWVASGVVAAACVLPFASPLGRSSRSRLRPWLREQKTVMLSLFADRGIVSATQQSVIYVIALLIGLEGNAAYRGAQVVMGPVNVFAMGLVTALVPYFVRIWNQHPEQLAKRVTKLSISSAAALLILTQLVATMPDFAGRLLVGQSWDVSAPILPILALMIPLQVANFAVLGALRAMGRVGKALIVRVVITPLTLVAVIAAAYFGNIAMVIWAQVGCLGLSSLLWWIVLLRANREALPKQGGAPTISASGS